MKHHKVDSSHLSSIGHEDTILEVRFKNGALYSYYGVIAPVFTALLRAESVGKAFHAHVRGHYPETLVEDL